LKPLELVAKLHSLSVPLPGLRGCVPAHTLGTRVAG
jgi:hypothetical protein